MKGTENANKPAHRVRRALRHTPRSRRPNCVAIRPDLDPWYYPTLESFKAALADGTLHAEYGCRTREECIAAGKDGLL